MISILNNIQDDICKYAEAISGMTEADVEIVDEFMIRVAGTGKYRNLLNLNVESEGHIYRHVMQSKKTILVANPRENELCLACEKHLFCTEKLDLTSPIFFNDRVIGVISIICSTDQHKEMLLAQVDKFIHFIEQIAELISGKVFEYIERLRAQEISSAFKNLIEIMDRGVIALNSDNIIWHSNLSANRMFNQEASMIGKQIIIDTTKDIIYGHEEAYLTLEDKSLHVLYKKIALSSLEGDRKTMIIFQDAKDYIPVIESTSFENNNRVKLIGNSAAIAELQRNIDKISVSHASVLISGETGVGKEVVALAIHQNSSRCSGPFITINCAAIPDQLLESELFGYVRGAFSGADPKGRVGKFELAHGGTLFLDEIGDMPINLQAKLLRVLQERCISKIGSNNIIKIDVRIIAATNKNIIDLIEQKQFREDLYYRLNVVPLALAPLRERKEDIAALAQFFADEFSTLYKTERIKITNEIINCFYFYDWPGNIRELQNVLEYMYVMKGDSTILNQSHLPPHLLNLKSKIKAPTIIRQKNISLKKIDAQAKKEAILSTLNQYGWDLLGKKKTANILGIGIATLYRKLKQFELDETK